MYGQKKKSQCIYLFQDAMRARLEEGNRSRQHQLDVLKLEGEKGV